MVKVSIPNLLAELKSLKYDAKVQEETNQVFFIFKHEKREFPLFIRLIHDGELVQMLTFLPTQVKKEQFSDVARFLHIVNKELDVPGFCIDETSSTVFYRLIIPTVKKELDKEIFEALLNTSQVVCKTFSPPVEAMAQGLMTLEAVLKKAEEAKAAI
jgi:hypothetical protein